MALIFAAGLNKEFQENPKDLIYAKSSIDSLKKRPRDF